MDFSKPQPKFPGISSHITRRSGNAVYIDFRKEQNRREIIHLSSDECFDQETLVRMYVMKYLLADGRGNDTELLEEAIIQESTTLIGINEDASAIHMAQAAIDIVHALYDDGLKNLRFALIKGRYDANVIYDCGGILSYTQQKIPSGSDHTELRKTLRLAQGIARQLPENQRLCMLLETLEHRVTKQG